MTISPNKVVARLIRMLKRRAPLYEHDYPWPSMQFIDAVTARRIERCLHYLTHSGHIKSVKSAQYAEVRRALQQRKKDIANFVPT